MHRNKHTFILLFLLFLTGIKQLPLQAQQDNRQHLSLPATDSTVIQSRIDQALSFRNRYPDSALHTFRQTLAESNQAGYTTGIVQSLTELGYLSVQNGNVPDAFLFFYQALSYPVSKPYRAYIYNGIANAYNSTGQFREAIRAYYNALHLIDSFPNDQIIPAENIYYNLITVLSQIGAHEKALTHIETVLPLAAAKKNHAAYSNLLHIKGVCYYAIQPPADRLDSFVKYADSSLYIAREHGLVRPVLQALINLGDICLDEGFPEKAIDRLKEAEALLKNHKTTLALETGLYRSLAKTYLKAGNYKNAEKYYLISIERSAAIPKEQLLLYEDLASFYHNTAQYSKAYKYQKAYQVLNDSIRSKDVSLAVNELETRYRTAEKDKEIAVSKLLISNQEKKLAQKNFWIIAGFSGVAIIALLAVWRSSYFRHQYAIRQLQAKTEGEEAERQRLAQELHDGINSQIAGINSFLYTLAEKHPDIHKDEVFTTIDKALQQTSSDIRKVARNLLPVSFAHEGMAAHIRTFIRNLTADKNIETDFQAYGSTDDIGETLALNIYRIIQELLHNVIKHADATEIIVLLNREDNQLSITVEDNGKGIGDNIKDKGVGLQNVSARTKAHNGRLIIESASGSGTVVTVIFPIV